MLGLIGNRSCLKCQGDKTRQPSNKHGNVSLSKLRWKSNRIMETTRNQRNSRCIELSKGSDVRGILDVKLGRLE